MENEAEENYCEEVPRESFQSHMSVIYDKGEEDEEYEYDEEEEEDEEDVDGIHRNNDPLTTLLKSYLDEFNQVYCHAQLVYRDTIASSSFFYLIFPIQELLIDYEHLQAFGLTNELSIRVDFIVDSSNQIGTITLRNISLYDPSNSTISDLELAWILKLRLSEYFKEIGFQYHQKANTQSTAISQVMETTNCSLEEAERALEQTKGDLNDALIYLMDTPQNLKSTSTAPTTMPTATAIPPVIDLTFEEHGTSTEEQLSHLQQLFPTIDFDTLLSIYQSTDCSYYDTVAIIQLQDSTLLTQQGVDLTVAVPEETPISQLINSIIRESHHHSLLPLDTSHPNKFFILFLLIEGEIISCGSRCLICNQLLTFPGILPAVCGGNLCVMGYEELGVGIDLQIEILKNPLVMDLLISFLYSSAFSNRQRLDLLFPSSVKVYDQNNIEHSFLTQVQLSLLLSLPSLHTKGSSGVVIHNYPLLQSLVELIPSVNQLSLWSHEKVLKEKLNEIHVLLFPLLLWLLRSNRSYLRILGDDEVPNGIKGKYVFALTSGPMEKEANFQKIRQTTPSPEQSPISRLLIFPSSLRSHWSIVSPHLSFFFFHGSSIDNWHSILRTGLRNFSNTQYMTNGAAYGKGVYFSPKLSVSTRYSPPTNKIWGSSEVLKQLDQCLAICEIINRPAEIKRGNGEIFVVTNEDHIAPRFLVISPLPDCVQNSLDLDYDNVLKALKRKS